MDSIKAITLWQPYASAIAWGFKRYETRGWPTSHRGPIAIHAAMKCDRTIGHMVSDVCTLVPEFRDAMRGNKRNPYSNMDFGAVVAIAEITDCMLTDALIYNEAIGATEKAFGDYSPGRYAWRLENIRAIKPIPVSGAQGFWQWVMPDKVEYQS